VASLAAPLNLYYKLISCNSNLVVNQEDCVYALSLIKYICSEVYASPTAVDFLQFWIIDVQILSGESGSPVQVSVTRFRLILYVVVSVSALY